MNQNVCFTCGFNVKDWHTSATCPRKKQGHQDGFTCSNYMEYESANHQFSVLPQGDAQNNVPNNVTVWGDE